jgi:hypothetical protein
MYLAYICKYAPSVGIGLYSLIDCISIPFTHQRLLLCLVRFFFASVLTALVSIVRIAADADPAVRSLLVARRTLSRWLLPWLLQATELLPASSASSAVSTVSALSSMSAVSSSSSGPSSASTAVPASSYAPTTVGPLRLRWPALAIDLMWLANSIVLAAPLTHADANVNANTTAETNATADADTIAIADLRAIKSRMRCLLDAASRVTASAPFVSDAATWWWCGRDSRDSRCVVLHAANLYEALIASPSPSTSPRPRSYDGGGGGDGGDNATLSCDSDDVRCLVAVASALRHGRAELRPL